MSACAAQTEVTPQIRVVPGAAARALWLGDRAGPNVPLPRAPTAPAPQEAQEATSDDAPDAPAWSDR